MHTAFGDGTRVPESDANSQRRALCCAVWRSRHHDDSSGQDMADSIEFHDNVQGPVSMIDMTAGSLVVLGQNVIVSTDTSFGVTIMPASLAGLAVNDIVEVSGMPAANGDIHATRIEKKAVGAAFEVAGVAASTNVSAKILKISALTVDFSAAALVGFPSTGPKDGDRVEATGTSLGSAGDLKATHPELLADDEFGQANEEGELEGLITRFASATAARARPVATKLWRRALSAPRHNRACASPVP